MEINDVEVQIDFIKFVRMNYEYKQWWSQLRDISIIVITGTTTATAATLMCAHKE